MSDGDFLSPFPEIIEITEEGDGEGSSVPTTFSATECPICFDPCTNEGDHRLVATRCGHLFGKSCINTALTFRSECPSCRKKCKRKEVIDLWDCHIVAADASAINQLEVEVSEERLRRQRIEAEKALMNVKLHEALNEIRVWKQRCESMQVALSEQRKSAAEDPSRKRARLNPGSSNESEIDMFNCMWTVAGIRDGRLLRVSNDAINLLFSSRSIGGQQQLTLISIEDYRKTDLLATTDAVIRDIAVSPWISGSDLVAHTGDSRSISIVSSRSKGIAMKMDLLGQQGWCCAFSESNEHEVWVGGSSGCVMLFDVRKSGAANCQVALYEVPEVPQETGDLGLSQSLYTIRVKSRDVDRYEPKRTLPPVQSMVYSKISTPANSTVDEDQFPYEVTTSDNSADVAAPIERLVISQKGSCSLVIPSDNKTNAEIVNSASNRALVPRLFGVYDIQKIQSSPWCGPCSAESPSAFIFACRKHSATNSITGVVQEVSTPSVSLIGLRGGDVPGQGDGFERGGDVVGHGVGLSPARPSALMFPYSALRHLRTAQSSQQSQGAVYSQQSRHTALDIGSGERNSAVLVVCPDEPSRRVTVSAVFSAGDVKLLGRLPAHREPVRQTAFAVQSCHSHSSSSIAGNISPSLACISSNELRLYNFHFP